MLPPSTRTRDNWPPDYTAVFAWRQQQLLAMREDPKLLYGALEYYRTRPKEFINHWMDTYDPRVAGKPGRMAKMPFVMFERQGQMVDFILACLKGEENGLMEKARDLGATWICCAVSVWMWRFWDGASIGWGSRKEALVDKIGDPDSIFEKMRILIRRLPREFWPEGFDETRDMAFMRIVNPATGATITGEAGDSIGRGGRKLIYFKDESAHYERPEKIEAALSDNTRVQIDISSVNGLGNVFHRRRENGVEWIEGPAHKGVTNVFVMDWRDHPEKDDAWYLARKKKAEMDGLLHVFAQEVERNYAAAVDGVVIPQEWIISAIDADVKLGLHMDTGPVVAALDVADEGGDSNALPIRKGVRLNSLFEWEKGDTGKTTRRAIAALMGSGPVELQYDCVGVGAGVKSEANRLEETGQLPSTITFVPWSAGAGVQRPDENVEPDDKLTPLNKDFYANLKAQGWWQLRRRFEKTHRAITEGIQYPTDEMICLPSDLPGLRKLQKELGQATMGQMTGSLKLAVNKRPPGTKSPNLADAVMMCYWPVVLETPVAMMLLSERNRG
jgi:phage terminase large subunit